MPNRLLLPAAPGRTGSAGVLVTMVVVFAVSFLLWRNWSFIRDTIIPVSASTVAQQPAVQPPQPIQQAPVIQPIILRSAIDVDFDAAFLHLRNALNFLESSTEGLSAAQERMRLVRPYLSINRFYTQDQRLADAIRRNENAKEAVARASEELDLARRVLERR